MIETKDFPTAEQMDEWVNKMGEEHDVFATQTFRIADEAGVITLYSATVFWR